MGEPKHTVFWMRKCLAYERYAEADPRTTLIKALCRLMDWGTFRTEPIYQADLCKLTGLKARTLQRAIANIVDDKVVEVEGGRGRGNKTVFVLCEQKGEITSQKKASSSGGFCNLKRRHAATEKASPGDATLLSQESDSGKRADRSIQDQAEPFPPAAPPSREPRVFDEQELPGLLRGIEGRLSSLRGIEQYERPDIVDCLAASAAALPEDHPLRAEVLAVANKLIY